MGYPSVLGDSEILNAEDAEVPQSYAEECGTTEDTKRVYVT
jgi:hypothetical protein